MQKPTGPPPEDTIEINMRVSLKELYMLEPNVTLSTPDMYTQPLPEIRAVSMETTLALVSG